MSQFTPGPWRCEPHPNRLGYLIVVDIGQDLGPVPPEIAQFVGSEANAHLIAAAPKMYEALKKCYLLPRPWLDGGTTWPDWDDAMENIQAALAKAEGRS